MTADMVDFDAESSLSREEGIRDLLATLREHVGTVTDELRNLRRENAVLRERVAELEEQVDHDGTVILLDEDPEVVRKKIQRYIDTLDVVLGQPMDEEDD